MPTLTIPPVKAIEPPSEWAYLDRDVDLDAVRELPSSFVMGHTGYDEILQPSTLPTLFENDLEGLSDWQNGVNDISQALERLKYELEMGGEVEKAEDADKLLKAVQGYEEMMRRNQERIVSGTSEGAVGGRPKKVTSEYGPDKGVDEEITREKGLLMPSTLQAGIMSGTIDPSNYIEEVRHQLDLAKMRYRKGKSQTENDEGKREKHIKKSINWKKDM